MIRAPHVVTCDQNRKRDYKTKPRSGWRVIERNDSKRDAYSTSTPQYFPSVFFDGGPVIEYEPPVQPFSKCCEAIPESGHRKANGTSLNCPWQIHSCRVKAGCWRYARRSRLSWRSRTPGCLQFLTLCRARRLLLRQREC